MLTHGVTALDYFVVGRVLTAEQHPDADRLTVCTVAIGEGDTAQIVCGAPNVAAGQTVAVASPGAVMPDGTKLKRAKLRGVESHGMILAEDELAIGTEHDGIMVLDDDLAARHAARGRPADRHRRARARDHAEPAGLPERLRRRPRGPRRHGRADRAAAVGRGPGQRRPRRGRAHRGPRLRAVPAVHRAAVRERHDRAVAGLAEGAPERRRPAPDQQRRRHHELRDAADRSAAARVRLGPRGRRPPRRPARRRRRDDAHARRRRADAGQRHAADRRRRRPDLDRRDHGRPALRGTAEHDPRPDGGGELERAEPPAHLVPARAAHGGVRALREGPRRRS